ncbi:dihydrofolate reductase family protein [Lacisediminihabitans changchengi]|uniref:Dihydrofolate reductase family protein n=1 Tax=Lacisediminihabitans changchengi TaxID=2787634 RepID=A0A934SI89_9MICO|nr:dihydrofolate reductase family protein [Lacisediminihabitans changchengi]MBK4347136.1 dihydrofolate reductase family protein [Lacisediminihabitans changchengi]
MARLIYSSISSLDGYIADRDGDFRWAAPDAEVHGFINDLQRSSRTWLFGRRTYDVMTAWETIDNDAPEMRDFAEQWHAADKLVFSRTLDRVDTARTDLRRDFDATEVARLKDRSEHDLVIGGPGIAAEALRAGLVDEILQFVCPVVVGGGTRFLPDGLRMSLQLLEERRFDASDVVYLRYRVA